MPRRSPEEIEMQLLLEGVMQRYGQDFRDYAPASLKRRLQGWLADSGFDGFSQAQAVVLRDAAVADSLLRGLTVNVSELFRDPPLFRALREHVIPALRTRRHARLWVAGCAGGEEVYSLAILLHEAGLLKRCRLYATDINEQVLQQAREGIFPIARMPAATRNYRLAGGQRDFADYYTARYEHALIAPQLKENVVFAAHNLIDDAAFAEMDLTLCRNVLIYFKPGLVERVLVKLDAGLNKGGYLGLGEKESLEHRGIARQYLEVAQGVALYRKHDDQDSQR